MSFAKNCKWLMLKSYIRLCRLIFGIKPNRVFFISFDGKSYSDNPKAISEELHRVDDNIEICWGFNDPDSKSKIIPEYVKPINIKSSLVYFKYLATSGVWVNNFSPIYIPKSKKQLFIQTWHGDRAFKKVLCDSDFFDGKSKPVEALDGYCDYAVAGSEYGVRQYRTAFLYKGEVLKEGTPRNDRLVNFSASEKATLKRQLGIEDKKVVLYAPTLRRYASNKNTFQKSGDLDIQSIINSLESKYGEQWVCFVRAHSAVKGLSGIEYNDRIIDVSGYEDMADLLLVADMLITDYSSCAGDFALLDKPIVLYQSDYDEYLEYDRTFYFEMSDSPYFIANSQDEMNSIIDDLTDESIEKNCKEILDFYGTTETGRASEHIAELIIKHINSIKIGR